MRARGPGGTEHRRPRLSKFRCLNVSTADRRHAHTNQHSAARGTPHTRQRGPHKWAHSGAASGPTAAASAQPAGPKQQIQLYKLSLHDTAHWAIEYVYSCLHPLGAMRASSPCSNAASGCASFHSTRRMHELLLSCLVKARPSAAVYSCKSLTRRHPLNRFSPQSSCRKAYSDHRLVVGAGCFLDITQTIWLLPDHPDHP